MIFLLSHPFRYVLLDFGSPAISGRLYHNSRGVWSKYRIGAIHVMVGASHRYTDCGLECRQFRAYGISGTRGIGSAICFTKMKVDCQSIAFSTCKPSEHGRISNAANGADHRRSNWSHLCHNASLWMAQIRRGHVADGRLQAICSTLSTKRFGAGPSIQVFTFFNLVWKRFYWGHYD